MPDTNAQNAQRQKENTMSDRIVIDSIPTTNPTQFLRTEVYYLKSNRARGFYLSAGPITDRGDGFISFALFAGESKRIEEATRFNAKKLAHVAARVTQLPTYKELIDAAVAKNKLVLVHSNTWRSHCAPEFIAKMDRIAELGKQLTGDAVYFLWKHKHLVDCSDMSALVSEFTRWNRGALNLTEAEINEIDLMP
jgi:hypothetical protein